MSFELINASATFQKLINHVLYDHLNDFVVTYLNDVLVFLKTFKEHKKHVKKVLKRLEEKKLFVKSDKYEFYKQEVKYLRHIVTMKEIRMNFDKIKAVLKFPTPICVKNI